MSDEVGKGIPDEEFSALLASLDKAAPLVRALSKDGQEPSAAGQGGDRRALLCALKPYLSPSRCEAVDYLLRLWQMGDAIKRLMGEG